jgi:hypothetical protein
MSEVAFKKKSVIQYGSNRSGKPPGGIYTLNPYGSVLHGGDVGSVGFSIEGNHRNVGYIGKSYAMSKMGTPFRGSYPCFTSGKGGYSHPVFNVSEVLVLGTQNQYAKPSVLSTRGMLRKRFKWAYSGQYPNYWVQPNYTGNMTDSSSQGAYVSTLSAANDCVVDVNKDEKFVGYTTCGGPTLCSTTTARYKFNDMARNAPYTKTTKQPLTSSGYTLRVKRPCTDPIGTQKPFPFAVNGGSVGHGGVGGISGGNSGTCLITKPTYLSPPSWYTSSVPGNSPIQSS